MNAAVYTGTKNTYKQMLISAKSLLEHSNVEKIYFLIEDDIFPYELSKEIECINISNQNYFDPEGPNFNNVCTYMVLIRAAFPKIFPDLNKILSIDMDTIVNENISELWELNIDNYYLAGVEEKKLTQIEGSYINMGVVMFNLKKMREDHIDDKLIYALNNYWYRYKEQDCFNEYLRGKILILPSDYNVCIQSNEPQHEKITHFAGIYNLEHFPHFNYYQNLQFTELKRNIQDNITLDIIIPTYKNKNGLRITLNSIIQEWKKNFLINIIVVDDCSNLDYSDILMEYPQIHFYQLNKNSGPGMARQYGIEHSNGTYIVFLDTGDYFYENGLTTIMNEIQKNTYIKLYSFSYVYDNNNKLIDIPSEKTIGNVYKRSFIEMYNIHFNELGSYANEDYGFIRAARIIINYLENKWKFHKMTKHIFMPTFYEHIDNTSLTKKDNNDFFYTKLSEGIIINGIHAITIAKKAKVDIEYIIKELARIMAREYYYFLSIVYERPELSEEVWEKIKEFYFQYYRVYSKIANNSLRECYTKITIPCIKAREYKWEKHVLINIDKFLKELEEEEFVPIRYYQ